MANTFTGSLSLAAMLSLSKNTATPGVNSGNVLRLVSGSNTFPSLSSDIANGTGSGQANQLYAKSFTITTGSNQDLDLAGSLANEFGETITFAKIKGIIVCIASPDGTKKVRVGPQGVANGAQLWFGGTGATVYEEVEEVLVRGAKYTGWTVVAGTDVLRINNPTASSVTVHIALWGTE
jgi:hypothetical protein